MAIIVGTTRGVFEGNETDNNKAVAWHELGVGVPSAVVADIVYNAKDDRLLVATAGRHLGTHRQLGWLPDRPMDEQPASRYELDDRRQDRRVPGTGRLSPLALARRLLCRYVLFRRGDVPVVARGWS